MTWWPGWDSVDSAEFWSHFWFWVAIVCLFAVGASTLISHIYGLRKDDLVSDKMATLAAGQTANVEVPQERLGKDITSDFELRKVAPPRVLSLGQRQTLIAALRPFAGQKVRVVTLVGGDEGLASDFVDVFRAAEWQVDPGSRSQVVIATRLFGLQPTINRTGSVPAAFSTLVDTLAALGLGPQTGFADEQTPIGAIDLKIGIRGIPTEK